MKYRRMPIEIESPEELGYDTIEINLAESSVWDKKIGDLKFDINDLLLAYGSHRGKDELRDLIAAEQDIERDNVLLTAGAASALFIAYSSLLEKDDHLVVIHPNYSTNIEIPNTLECDYSLLNLKFENKWKVDFDHLTKLVKKNTKIISLTSPHNPTGVVLEKETFQAIVRFAEERNMYVLIDETYRDLSFNQPISYVSLSKKVISVSSVSKAFGLPGIRIGWVISKNKELMEKFLAAKEQIFICNSVVDEEIAYQFIKQKSSVLNEVKERVQLNFEIVKQWMGNHSLLSWVEPTGGVVCFPKVNDEQNIDLDVFYKMLLEKYSTYVGPGHWFGMDRRFFRIGFGWPETNSLKKGLSNIDLCLQLCWK